MKQAIKRLLRQLGLAGVPRSAAALRFRRWLQKKRRMAVYVGYNAPVRKLHIGCGTNILPGWLNADFNTLHPAVFHLDATRRFPFRNGEFAFVFSEHMIEHVSYSDGLAMLSECYRVMDRGATIRISTPNLAFVIDLYQPDKTNLQQQFLDWSADIHLHDRAMNEDTFVINNYVRDWGHLFIYDEKVLRKSLAEAGFKDIVRCELQDSRYPDLRNLENESRKPAGLLRLETITMEGTKA